ncbi:LytR/AlgR family response regulator transcription factor [Neolewinella persica]|uniref:LytR/AlgR family response regulator transcription factor n=1 Tax=Neolewinella persica TaxID=70998 RepID=UPI000362E4E3|nr:LytTR family transcriptional regulator DNA-binding domain-containing protein [Neolewinella persica]
MKRNEKNTSAALLNSKMTGFRANKRLSGLDPKKLNLTRTIIIEQGKLRIRIPVQNILFVRAEHVYSRFFFQSDQQTLRRISLDKLLTKLPEEFFIRVHRSYFVNLTYVREWTSSKVMIGEEVIPIGRTYKDQVVPILKQVTGI